MGEDVPVTAPADLPRPGGAWGGLLLVCGAGVVWGTIGPGVGLVHERSSLSVFTTGAYRGVAAVVTLLLAASLARQWGHCRALLRQHGRRVLAVGVLTALFQLLFFVAVFASGVSIATVVAPGFAPVLLLVVGAVRRRRPPSWAEAVTVGAAVLGLALVGSGGGPGPHVALGVLAALGSGTAYGLSAYFGAPLMEHHDALAVTTCTTTVVGAVLVPGGLVVALFRGEPMGSTDVGTWLLIGYLGAITLAFAYGLFFAGLRRTPSGTAVVATLLEPVTGVLIAVAFLGERLSPLAVVGTLLILGAIGTLGRRTETPV